MTEPFKSTRLKQKADALKSRGVYLLPNLFTTTALFSGFFSIINAVEGYFDVSAIAIFVAMVFDALDGRVARLTHTQSDFGAQYDSLSDMVSFGVAPSILVYECALHSFGKLGWAAAFVFCAAVALRLARFNSNTDKVDKRYFQGLPSPAGAAIVASLVWVLANFGLLPLKKGPSQEHFYIWTATVAVGLLMVSNVPFFSGKSFNFRRSVSTGTLMFLVIFIVSIAVLWRNTAQILLLFFVTYALIGLFLAVYRFFWPAVASGDPVHDVMDVEVESSDNEPD